MIIVVLPDVIISALNIHSAIPDIIFNQKKYDMNLISCREIEDKVVDSFKNENADIIRVNKIILKNLLSNLHLYSKSDYNIQNDYMVSDLQPQLVPFFTLALAKNAKYIWTDLTIKFSQEQIQLLSTSSILKDIIDSSQKILQIELENETKSDGTADKFNDIYPAIKPPYPKTHLDPHLNNQECRFIAPEKIDEMEYTIADAEEFLSKVGIYSYRLDDALFFEDLYMDNFSEIKYYEVETYQLKIEPYGKITRYTVDISNLTHLMDIFIDKNEKLPKVVDFDKKFHFKTGIRDRDKSKDFTEEKPKKTRSEPPMEIIMLDSKRFNLNPNKFEEHAQKLDGETILEELIEILRSEFDNILTTETLIESQRLLKVKWKVNIEKSKEKGLNLIDKFDILEVTQFWENMMNAHEKKFFAI